jgi:hypothetical protein
VVQFQESEGEGSWTRPQKICEYFAFDVIIFWHFKISVIDFANPSSLLHDKQHDVLADYTL